VEYLEAHGICRESLSDVMGPARAAMAAGRSGTAAKPRVASA